MNQHSNTFSNVSNIGLALAVWLAHDDYDNGSAQHPGENLISATSLLKPTRQIVLAPRVAAEDRQHDISERMASQLGRAIHESVEKAWVQNMRPSMLALGYPKKMVEKLVLHPDDEQLKAGCIPVYLETRAFREIEEAGVRVLISGQFDLVINGEVHDIKTTSTYSAMSGSKDDDYRMQGSIYRWLNPERITGDVIHIHHVFTDWQRAQARQNPAYPQSRMQVKALELLSLAETERHIRAKIREIVANQNLPEDEVIRCTDAELWMSDPTYKFYSDPAKAAEGGRSTKNFTNYAEAMMHRNKAGKGVIVEGPRQAKACAYCPAFPVCTQAQEYLPQSSEPNKEATDDI